MPVLPLPDRSRIDQLRATAKLLRDLVRGGDPGAVEMVREHHPRLGDLAADTPGAAGFRLADAQLTLARHHGFASWPRLKAHVEVVVRLTRSPHRQPVGGEPTTESERVDELLRLACLTYGADDPDRARAALAMATGTVLSGSSLHAAAALGDVTAARRWLASDPTLAARDGGPFGWVPLLYAAYSRVDDPAAGRDTVGVARLLLDQGADPDAGYLWDGLPSPFTALTGAFGGGEGNQPPHARALELARLLLAHGADPNDSQTVYNRGLGAIPRDDTAWLALLLDHGLGTGDGGPWKRLLGHEAMGPAEVAGEALQHAATSGLVARVRVLLEHGVDPGRPGGHPAFGDRTPYDAAVRHGHAEIARLLAEAGADLTTDPTSPFVGAFLAADAAAVERLRTESPDALDRLRRDAPDLVTTAAELGRPEAVRLLAAHGFDVSHPGRRGPLHEAAYRGDGATVGALLEVGADPTVRDPEHDGTPAGWAAHGGHPDLARLLDDAAADWAQRSGGRSL